MRDPLLVMLSQDLCGWGLPGEQSVAALMLPLADASEALIQEPIGWNGMGAVSY